MMSEREKFTTILSNGPLLRGDAIVVLAGEDAEPRLSVAVELMRSGGADRIVLTGGRHEPPRITGAEALASALLAIGVAPDRITVDNQAMNTREQSVNVVAMAKANEWGRILLVASGYHCTRAYLTFVRAINEAGVRETLHIVNVGASHTPWFKPPAGMDTTRADLLAVEYDKIDTYNGHVATYNEGLEYLAYWEGK